MSLDADQLFALLPAVYRTRDAAAGGPLQALFAVMAAQSAIVEDNIRQLYDDQFIETCAPWVIPYIGDLIGYNSDLRGRLGEQRQPRRGRQHDRLPAAQGHAARARADVDGRLRRAAVAVEEFRRLITTESMRHVEPRHRATVDRSQRTRARRAWEARSTSTTTRSTCGASRRACAVPPEPDPAPLDIALHGPGRFNIPDVAIHLWRWQSWPVVGAPAFAVGGGRYMFSPLGNDMPLFSPPRAARCRSRSLTTRADVPAAHRAR